MVEDEMIGLPDFSDPSTIMSEEHFKKVRDLVHRCGAQKLGNHFLYIVPYMLNTYINHYDWLNKERQYCLSKGLLLHSFVSGIGIWKDSYFTGLCQLL